MRCLLQAGYWVSNPDLLGRRVDALPLSHACCATKRLSVLKPVARDCLRVAAFLICCPLFPVPGGVQSPRRGSRFPERSGGGAYVTSGWFRLAGGAGPGRAGLGSAPRSATAPAPGPWKTPSPHRPPSLGPASPHRLPRSPTGPLLRPGPAPSVAAVCSRSSALCPGPHRVRRGGVSAAFT